MEKQRKYKIDTALWKRRDHYNFFKKFEQPFFGLTTEIDCTEAYHYCKSYQVPFFMYYLHKSLLAVNKVREFRLRIEDNELVEYPVISGSVTVLRTDNTFGFAYFDFHERFKQFASETRLALDAEKRSYGLRIKSELTSLIHYSVLKEVRLLGVQHAQALSGSDSVPKIVFGKLRFDQQRVMLPVSVHMHHALCDGCHVEQFLKAFEGGLRVT